MAMSKGNTIATKKELPSDNESSSLGFIRRKRLEEERNQSVRLTGANITHQISREELTPH